MDVVDYIKNSFNLKNQGCYKPAIEMLYKALAIDSDNIEILAQLAHLYQLLGNYKRAIHYIDKVLELDDKHLDCLFLLKEIYLAQNAFYNAKGTAEKIYEVESKPENLAAIINIFNKLNDFESVKEIEAETKDPDDLILFEIASAYADNHERENAVVLLEKAYWLNKENKNVLFLLGKLYYENNEFEKAKKIFTELKKINACAEVLNYLGLFCLNENDFTKAIACFSDAHKQDKKNDEYVYNLASAYFLNGWMDEALKHFNQAICLSPNDINYHYSLAYLYYQKEQYDKASYELDFIKTVDQHHEQSLVLTALIAAKKGDLFDAKDQLVKLVKQNSSDDFALWALSETYKELSQIDAAKKALEKAIELKPTALSYLSNLAEIEIEQKDYEKATELAEKMLEINEKYLPGYIALAKINFEQKNFDLVFDAAQDIIERDQNCPEGYYYNALALFEQGDTLFATESLKKAISLDVNNASLYIKMSEFYQDLGDFKIAFEWAKEASEIDERNYKYKWLCAKLALILKKPAEAEKLYSQSFRLAAFDKDLTEDYANYLKSVGKDKQAKSLLK